MRIHLACPAASLLAACSLFASGPPADYARHPDRPLDCTESALPVVADAIAAFALGVTTVVLLSMPCADTETGTGGKECTFTGDLAVLTGLGTAVFGVGALIGHSKVVRCRDARAEQADYLDDQEERRKDLEQEVDQLIKQAASEYAARRFASAGELYKQAYELDARPALLLMAARAYRFSGDCVNALSCYRLFRGRYPGQASANSEEMHIVFDRECAAEPLIPVPPE